MAAMGIWDTTDPTTGAVTGGSISSAISDTANSVTGLVSDNLPVIVGVVAAFIGLAVAKRFVRGLGH